MAPPPLVQEVNTESEWLTLLQIEVCTYTVNLFQKFQILSREIIFYNARAYTSGFTEILQKKNLVRDNLQTLEVVFFPFNNFWRQ